MREPQLALPFSDLRQQERAAELGMWVFLATEVLFFGGLLLAYVVYRLGYPEGFAEGARHTKIVLGTVNTVVLLSSSFVVAWAVVVTSRGAARAGAVLFFAAAALGGAFLAVKGVEYLGEFRENLVPGTDFALESKGAELFFLFYFIATGLHAVHVTIGIVLLAFIGLRAWQGAYSPAWHTPASLAGLYWHFVDIVWIFLFPLIYLPGRGA